MTDKTHISSADLAALNGKVYTEKALSRRRDRAARSATWMGDVMNLLGNFGLMVAQLGFLPLARYTVESNYLLDWIPLLICGLLVMLAAGNEGPFTWFGTVCLALVCCVAAPLFFGFAIVMVVGFAGGGFQFFVDFWKPILFFGFGWYWFAAHTQRR